MQSADRASSGISPETIGEILVSEGEITRRQLDEAWNMHGEGGQGLDEILISLGHTTAEDLSRILSHRLGTRYAILSEEEIDPDLANLVQGGVLTDCGAVPLRIQDGSLVVAMENPDDGDARSCVAQSAGHPIVPVAASEDAIRVAQERLLKRDGSSGDGGSGDGQPGPQRGRAGSRRGGFGAGRIGDMLISEGKITQQQLEHGLKPRKNWGRYCSPSVT